MSDKRYFTGKPCKRGHIAERYVSSRACVICSADKRRRHYAENREQGIAKTRQWRLENPEEHRRHSREYARRNPEKVAANNAAYRRNNPEKCAAQQRSWRQQNVAKCREYVKACTKRKGGYKEYQARWTKENAAHVRAKVAKRRALKLQRTPAWANLEAIKFFYECCPAGCQVDHIIPLQGKHISGLHVETNLQWLPVSVNASKGNRYEVT